MKVTIELGKSENELVKSVKAREGLKNKSEAIGFIIHEYCDDSLEVKKEYLEKLKRIKREKAIPVESFSSRYLERNDFLIKVAGTFKNTKPFKRDKRDRY